MRDLPTGWVAPVQDRIPEREIEQGGERERAGTLIDGPLYLSRRGPFALPRLYDRHPCRRPGPDLMLEFQRTGA